MKLISMTDYVLGIELLNQTAIKRLDMVFRYANFLKTPLELGMFVPTDEQGNVIDISKLAKSSIQDLETNGLSSYNKAKERVIFEDCSMFDEHFIRYGNGKLFHIDHLKTTTIEFFCGEGLTLTQNTIKTYKI